MNRKRILIFLFVILCNISSIIINNSYAARQVLAVTCNLPSHFNSILDDFNDGNAFNNWCYNTSCGGSSGTFSEMTFTGSAYEGARCLRFRYNAPNSGDYTWYASQLGMENAALSNFNGLTFWVKGSNGNETLKVDLKTVNCNTTGRSNAHLYINDFMDGQITTSWKKVVIPFKNFANITNFSKLNEFVLAAEHDQAILNGSPSSGVVYIDLIKFTNCSGGFNPIYIDNFSDKVFISGLGGNIWTGSNSGYAGGGTTSFSGTAGQFTNVKYGLKITYHDITFSGGSAWYATAFLFGGGNDGNTSQGCNFSDYSKLTFWAKNQDGVRKPKQIQVTLKDSAGGSQAGYTAEASGGSNPELSTSWQKYTLSFSLFPSVNFNRLKEISLTIGAWCSDNSTFGTIYLDQLQFEK